MSTPESHTGKPKKSVALSGVTAGNTALCSVGRSGNDLHYRGYDILEVAETCEFEEIAYLLIHGKLPNKAQLAAYKTKLKSLRGLPAPVRAVLEQLPAGHASHGRDAHRRVGAGLRAAREADDHDAAGAREIADHLRGVLRLDALLLVSLLAQRPAHPRRDRRRFGRRPFPAPAAPPAAAGELGARHAHLAHSLRRARVQFVDVHGARDRRHGLGHLLLHHRRHRRAARPASTAAPTKSRSRSRSATTRPTRPRPTSAGAWPTRKS